jgi:hypothetical protein
MDTDVDIKLTAANSDTNEPFLMYDADAGTGGAWVKSDDGVSTVIIGTDTSSFTGGEGITLTAGVIAIDEADTLEWTAAHTWTIADTGNAVAIAVTNNDTTNDPNSVTITDVVTGTSLFIDKNGTEATGLALDIDYTLSGDSLTGRTGSLATIDASRTDSRTAGTTADDYDVLSLSRTSVTTGAGGTLTAAGSVLKIENVVTQTAGTLTDTVNVLELVQDADSTGHAISVDVNGESVALSIDTEATTADGIDLQPTVMTTGVALRIDDADALTTGGIALFKSNSADTGTRNLLEIVNDNTAATGATVLKLQQDADETALLIDSNDGMSIDIDSEEANDGIIMRVTPAGTGPDTWAIYRNDDVTGNVNMKLGANYFWVDTNGDFRMKNGSLPTGDTGDEKILTDSDISTSIGKGKATQHSRATGLGTGTQDLAHSLGATPRYIRITTVQDIGASSNICHGGATGTSDEVFIATDTAGSTNAGSGLVVNLEGGTGEASISAVDGTNVTLNWSQAVSTATAFILLEVWE